MKLWHLKEKAGCKIHFLTHHSATKVNLNEEHYVSFSKRAESLRPLLHFLFNEKIFCLQMYLWQQSKNFFSHQSHNKFPFYLLYLSLWQLLIFVKSKRISTSQSELTQNCAFGLWFNFQQPFYDGGYKRSDSQKSNRL